MDSNKNQIKLSNIYKASNGDYLYELELSAEMQNIITENAAILGITTEEYLRQRIIKEIGLKVKGE